MLNKKRKFIGVLIYIAVCLAIIVATIDGFHIYTLSSNELVETALKAATDLGLQEPQIIAEHDTGHSHIFVLSDGTSYCALPYSRSLVYGRYRVSTDDSNIYTAETNNEYTYMTADPVESFTFNVKVDPDGSYAEISITSQTLEWIWRIGVFILITGTMGLAFISVKIKNRKMAKNCFEQPCE